MGDKRYATFEFLTPDTLDSVADLVPLGVMSIETKAVKLQQMMEWGKTFGSQPFSKMYDLARRAWIEMAQSDPDTVTLTPDEWKQFVGVKQQLMNQGMNQGSLPPPGPGQSPRPEMNPAINPNMAAMEPNQDMLNFQGGPIQ